MTELSFVLEFRVTATQEWLGTLVEARGEKGLVAVLEDVLQALQDAFASPIEVLVVRRVEPRMVGEQVR